MFYQVSSAEVLKGNRGTAGHGFNPDTYMPEIAESIMSDEEND